MSHSSSPSRTSSAVAKSKTPKPVAADRVEPPSGIWREPIPMKPRKRLFLTLLIVLAVWVGILLTMYFTMVRPHHPPHRPPQTPRQATAPASPLEATKALS
jgi:hypothetical protein